MTIFQTYNTDFQVPDSAGTATALFSGVKTGKGVLGLDGTAKYNVCDTAVVETTRLETLLDWAVGAGKEVSNTHNSWWIRLVKKQEHSLSYILPSSSLQACRPADILNNL